MRGSGGRAPPPRDFRHGNAPCESAARVGAAPCDTAGPPRATSAARAAARGGDSAAMADTYDARVLDVPGQGIRLETDPGFRGAGAAQRRQPARDGRRPRTGRLGLRAPSGSPGTRSCRRSTRCWPERPRCRGGPGPPSRPARPTPSPTWCAGGRPTAPSAARSSTARPNTPENTPRFSKHPTAAGADPAAATGLAMLGGVLVVTAFTVSLLINVRSRGDS